MDRSAFERNAVFFVFFKKGVRIVHSEAEANGGHLMFVLELKMQLDIIADHTRVVRRLGFVAKGNLESKALVECESAFEVASPDNRLQRL